MRTIYHLGRSGREAFLTAGSYTDIIRIAPCLPPGEYWVMRTRRDKDDDGTAWEESEDWGTLLVRDSDDWLLESLAGFRAGPGYIGVL